MPRLGGAVNSGNTPGDGTTTPDKVFTSGIPWLVSGTTNVDANVVVTLNNIVILTYPVSPGNPFNLSVQTQADANGIQSLVADLVDRATGASFATNTGSVQESDLSWAFNNTDQTEVGLAGAAINLIVDGSVNPLISGLRGNVTEMVGEMEQLYPAMSPDSCAAAINANIGAYQDSLKRIGKAVLTNGFSYAADGGLKFDLFSASNNPELQVLQAKLAQLRDAAQSPTGFTWAGSIGVNSLGTNINSFLESPTIQNFDTFAKNSLSANGSVAYNIQGNGFSFKAGFGFSGMNYQSKLIHLNGASMYQSLTPASANSSSGWTWGFSANESYDFQHKDTKAVFGIDIFPPR